MILMNLRVEISRIDNKSTLELKPMSINQIA